MTSMKSIVAMIEECTKEMEQNAQWGTAHVYKSTARSFARYAAQRNSQSTGQADVCLHDLTPALLKDYESWLRGNGCKWNTVATYMKTLRATYNRAVDEGQAAEQVRLFRHVRTYPTADRKRAIEGNDMYKLLKRSRKGNNPKAEQTRALRFFALMFLLRGMPFVDLCYLRPSDIAGRRLTYRRRKTGRVLTVELTDEALRLIKLLRRRGHSSYLFGFVHSPEGTQAAYHEYQLALRNFNRTLLKLSPLLPQITPRLSTYTARHTWATLAYRCEINPGIISEAMGHSSIKVTETYLKPFSSERIDRANREVIEYVKRMHAAG